MALEQDECRQLDRTLVDLVQRFPTVPESDIRARFDELVAAFDGAPVRTYVPVLVAKGVREALR